ncbi:MAG: type II toxin-antitoxin system RelE/ParE family toxin [Bacteroidales bacterium]|nr:type II toxin-antitoxin system RelE/ParE family toxin [Bacteroidales bacterium]
MAKRKIIWSNRANDKLIKILEFYNKRNQSRSYSNKLFKLITKNVKHLQSQPYLGLKSSLKPFRGLIINDFIIIHTLWDCRQNPDSLIIR